ncbi:MAG: alpha/beta hydrolase [Lachnospiraceae bacterium]|nr:alpha/beta hydrolase [Lachnospiraceae bacterium]
MSKKLKFLASTVTALTAVSVTAAESFLYILSNRKGNVDFLFKDEEENKTDLDRAIDKVRSEDYEWLMHQDLTHYYITSRDGLKLHASYLPAATETDRFVLCIHGYRCSGNREFDSISRFYHDLGINAFMIDHRAHGESEGNYITYGAKESVDCMDWLKFMRKEFGENIEIILHGVSMGAATVMIMTGKMLPNNVVFAVEDCGYSTLKAQLCYNFNQYHFPAELSYQLYRLSAKLRAHFDPEKCNPIEGVEQSNIPILFAHGEEDEFVPFDMVYANFDACPSPVKKLITVPGAKHAQAFQMDDQVKDAIVKMIDNYM